MIPPSRAWCAQIDITNACHFHCSNCTRILDHARKRFFMSVECFEAAIKALSGFVHGSERDGQGRGKVIGLIGGEPLLHPQFPELVDLMVEHIPDVANRGLWTSKDWKTGAHPKWGAYKPQVERLVGPHDGNGRGSDGTQGWLNWNMHLRSMKVEHQPVLVASKDAVPDERKRWELISECWLQTNWSPTVTPKGFYFCEVAGAIDMVLGGVGALPVEPGCWEGDLRFVEDENGVRRPVGPFADQIRNACERCGVCVPMKGRADSDEIDDVSRSNYDALVAIGSPRAERGKVQIHEFDANGAPLRRDGWNPRQYRKGGCPVDQSKAAQAEGAKR